MDPNNGEIKQLLKKNISVLQDMYNDISDCNTKCKIADIIFDLEITIGLLDNNLVCKNALNKNFIYCHSEEQSDVRIYNES